MTSPSTIERYLQWLIDNFREGDDEVNDGDEDVVVSIEAEAGQEF